MQFINLKTQYRQIENDIDKRIKKVLEHGKYIMGPEIEELEKKLADYTKAKHCIAVSSGTDALLIALMALGIGYGDEVITTPFSFFATAEIIVLLGAKPIFADIDSGTYNIDPDKIEKAITSKTKAIIPVSLYGQCADMDAINAIAKKYNISVIEDGAQSFGATYKGKMSCALSDIGCTSFFPSKPLGCYGDGGACFTNDDSIAKKMKEIRVHGQGKRYHHARIGINGRIDSIQAAILLSKLEIFPEEVETRAKTGERYTDLFKGSKIVVPYIESYNTSVYAQYTIQVDDRDDLAEKLMQKNIPTAVHYPIPLHMQPALKTKKEVTAPIAEKVSKRVISLPMHPFLEKKDQEIIADAVKDAVA